MSKTAKAVLAETKEAYYDCWNDWGDEAIKRRNLNFRANQPVTRDEAVEIMAQAVPHGYNAFNAWLLSKIPSHATITLARKHSVCVYVKGNLPENKDYENDEHTYYPPIPGTPEGETRLWWD